MDGFSPVVDTLYQHNLKPNFPLELCPQASQPRYDIVDFQKSDILNIIQGSSEVIIVTNERYKDKLIEILKDEKILMIEDNLVSLTMTFSKDFFYTPGVIFNIIRNVAWENINIYEIVSTNTELTFIIHKKDAMRGYKALEKLIQT